MTDELGNVISLKAMIGDTFLCSLQFRNTLIAVGKFRYMYKLAVSMFIRSDSGGIM